MPRHMHFSSATPAAERNMPARQLYAASPASARRAKTTILHFCPRGGSILYNTHEPRVTGTMPTLSSFSAWHHRRYADFA